MVIIAQSYQFVKIKKSDAEKAAFIKPPFLLVLPLGIEPGTAP